MVLVSSADFFSNLTFKKNSLKNTIRVSNSLDPDQNRHFVGPESDPNCLQRLSTVIRSCHLQGEVNSFPFQFQYLLSVPLKMFRIWAFTAMLGQVRVL